MKEDPAKLGVGHTSSGGTRGMAALEGLVAAIEVRSDSYLLRVYSGVVLVAL